MLQVGQNVNDVRAKEVTDKEVTQAINELLRKARSLRASKIFITPLRSNSNVTFLTQQENGTSAATAVEPLAGLIAQKLKFDAGLDPRDNITQPQTGTLSWPPDVTIEIHTEYHEGLERVELCISY